MDNKAIMDKVMTEASRLELEGVSFDNPCASMLVVDIGNIEDHIAKQPAGIAYYGSLARQAQRSLDESKKAWKYRWSEMYGIVLKAMHMADPKRKATVTEIESEMYRQFKDEIEKREADLDEKQMIVDNAELFFEAWQSKSFALNQLVNVAVSGLLGKDSYTDGKQQNENEKGVRSVIDIMRRKKQDQG